MMVGSNEVEMAGGALLHAYSLVLSPVSTPEQRAAATAQIDSYKKPEALHQALVIGRHLASNAQSKASRVLGLVLIEGQIKAIGNGPISQEYDGWLALRQCALDMLVECISGNSGLHLERGKVTDLVVSIALQQWPHRWPDLFDTLLTALPPANISVGDSNSAVTSAIILGVLATFVEHVTAQESLASTGGSCETYEETVATEAVRKHRMQALSVLVPPFLDWLCSHISSITSDPDAILRESVRTGLRAATMLIPATALHFDATKMLCSACVHLLPTTCFFVAPGNVAAEEAIQGLVGVLRAVLTRTTWRCTEEEMFIQEWLGEELVPQLISGVLDPAVSALCTGNLASAVLNGFICASSLILDYSCRAVGGGASVTGKSSTGPALASDAAFSKIVIAIGKILEVIAMAPSNILKTISGTADYLPSSCISLASVSDLNTQDTDTSATPCDLLLSAQCSFWQGILKKEGGVLTTRVSKSNPAAFGQTQQFLLLQLNTRNQGTHLAEKIVPVLQGLAAAAPEDTGAVIQAALNNLPNADKRTAGAVLRAFETYFRGVAGSTSGARVINGVAFLIGSILDLRGRVTDVHLWIGAIKEGTIALATLLEKDGVKDTDEQRSILQVMNTNILPRVIPLLFSTSKCPEGLLTPDLHPSPTALKTLRNRATEALLRLVNAQTAITAPSIMNFMVNNIEAVFAEMNISGSVEDLPFTFEFAMPLLSRLALSDLSRSHSALSFLTKTFAERLTAESLSGSLDFGPHTDDLIMGTPSNTTVQHRYEEGRPRRVHCKNIILAMRELLRGVTHPSAAALLSPCLEICAAFSLSYIHKVHSLFNQSSNEAFFCIGTVQGEFEYLADIRETLLYSLRGTYDIMADIFAIAALLPNNSEAALKFCIDSVLQILSSVPSPSTNVHPSKRKFLLDIHTNLFKNLLTPIFSLQNAAILPLLLPVFNAFVFPGILPILNTGSLLNCSGCDDHIEEAVFTAHDLAMAAHSTLLASCLAANIPTDSILQMPFSLSEPAKEELFRRNGQAILRSHLIPRCVAPFAAANDLTPPFGSKATEIIRLLTPIITCASANSTLITGATKVVLAITTILPVLMMYEESLEKFLSVLVPHLIYSATFQHYPENISAGPPLSKRRCIAGSSGGTKLAISTSNINTVMVLLTEIYKWCQVFNFPSTFLISDSVGITQQSLLAFQQAFEELRRRAPSVSVPIAAPNSLASDLGILCIGACTRPQWMLMRRLLIDRAYSSPSLQQNTVVAASTAIVHNATVDNSRTLELQQQSAAIKEFLAMTVRKNAALKSGNDSSDVIAGGICASPVVLDKVRRK